MILFTILAITLIVLIIAAVITLSVGGTAFIIVFGDLIVCAVIIGLIIRCLIKRRK